MALPALDRLLNTLEYFVHHEDIRRAAPGWEPRELTDREQADPVQGRGHGRQGPRPVRSAYPSRSAGPTASASARRCSPKGDDPVVVTGDPAELTMFLFGRDQHTGLKFEGPQDQRRRA